jgi:hypothetical protein
VLGAALESLQCLEVFSLLARQVRRKLDVDGGIEISAVIRLANRGHPMAFEAKHLAVLGCRRYLQAQRLAADRPHLDLAAKDRDRQRDANLCVQVLALALELRVRRHPDSQVKIASLRAASTLFAFTRDTHTRSVGDAGWNSHVNGSRVAILFD